MTPTLAELRERAMRRTPVKADRSEYTIVKHPRSKLRFAQLPGGGLIPNQGHMPEDAKRWTDADIHANFEIWKGRQ